METLKKHRNEESFLQFCGPRPSFVDDFLTYGRKLYF